jgi:hypothetical protein
LLFVVKEFERVALTGGAFAFLGIRRHCRCFLLLLHPVHESGFPRVQSAADPKYRWSRPPIHSRRQMVDFPPCGRIVSVHKAADVIGANKQVTTERVCIHRQKLPSSSTQSGILQNLLALRNKLP